MLALTDSKFHSLQRIKNRMTSFSSLKKKKKPKQSFPVVIRTDKLAKYRLPPQALYIGSLSMFHSSPTS